MKEEKKLLRNYIIYILVGLLIIIYGMFHEMPITFADTYNIDYLDDQVYYDNNGSSVSAVGQTWNESLQAYISNNITTASGSYGAGVAFNTAIPILANHTYTLTLAFEQNNANLSLSSKNRVSIGTSSSSASYNYANSNFYATMVQSQIVNSKIIQIVFTATGGGSYIFVPWTTTSTVTQRYVFTSYQIDDLGSSGISESTINNSLNNQTNIINNSITSSANNIISNSDSNRQAIIDNQNANNQALLDQNKETFNDCIENYFPYPYLFSNQTLNGITFTINSDKSITVSGTATQQFFQNIARITPNQYFTTNLGAGTTCQNGYCLYDTNYMGYTNSSGTIWFYFASGRTYNYTLKPMITKGSVPSEYIEPQSEKCTNKLDEQKNAINNLNDNITSDNVDDNDIANYFDDFNDFLDDNSTITQLITLPVTLYTAILNNLNGTCSPFNLGNLFGTNLILPCINISQYLGNSLWTMIDIIISGFAIYEIAKKFIKVFNNLSSLREGDVIDD